MWLPAAALKTPDTRARLGDPCDERVLLKRALRAYTVLLRQDRADTMVSVRPRATPAPSAAPTPAADEPAFPSWDDRDAYPYRALPTDQLGNWPAKALRAAAAVEHAAEERTRQARHLAATASPRPRNALPHASPTPQRSDRRHPRTS